MPKEPLPFSEADHNFAANLRAVRHAAGWTVPQLCEYLSVEGLAPSAIYKIETLDRRVSLGEAVAICRKLGVGLEKMAGGAVHPKVDMRVDYDIRL